MLERLSAAPITYLRTGVLALLVLSTGACNIFETEDEIADEARVLIEGTSPVPLQLITSTRFERTYNDDGDAVTILLVSDTAMIELGTAFDEVYPVKPDLGFFVRLRNLEADPATVSMRVYFDGELNYDQRNVSLSDASLEFSFIFSNFNTIG